MARPEAGVDVPDQPSSNEQPTPAEAPSLLHRVRVPSRRLLHLVLALILAVATVVWLIQPPSTGENIAAEEIDEPAPDFTLDLFDGGTFTLTGHLNQDGRPVVMNFWASWCVPCREEMPALDAVAHRHPEVLVLGVVVQDTETAARSFAEEIGVSYPLGLDADGAIIERYPTFGLPTTWFITSEGIIAARWMGQLDQSQLESLIERQLAG